MKQINFLNQVKRLSSIKQKTTITNFVKEAMRSAESYVNNVNKNLSTLNLNIRDFNSEILREQYEDCELDKNTKDIVCVLSKINLRELELANKTNLDLNMILTQEEIKKYFEKNLEFLKNKMKIHDNQIVYCVVHRDEDNIHMHTMFVMREENKAEMNDKEIEKSYDKIIKSTLKKRCSRQLKKFEIDSKNYEEIEEKVKDKNAFCEVFKINTFEEIKQFKNYKDFEKNYIKINYESQLQKTIQKINKNKSNKKYKYNSNTNNVNYFFENDVHAEFADYISKTEEFDKFKNVAQKIINDKIEVVKTLDKSIYAETKDLKELKERINFRKSNLINKFNSESITDAEYEEMLQLNCKEIEIKRKMQMTEEEYNKEFEKVQQMIKNNDFKIEKTQEQKLELLESNLEMFLKEEKSEVKNVFKNKIEVLKNARNTLTDEIENDIKRLLKQKKELKNEENEIIKTKAEIKAEKIELENQKNEIKDLKQKRSREIERLKNESISDSEIEEIKNEIKEQKIIEIYEEVSNNDNLINEEIKRIKKSNFEKYENRIFKEIEETCEFIEEKQIEDYYESKNILTQAYFSENETENEKFFDVIDSKNDYKYAEYEYEKSDILNDFIDKFEDLKSMIIKVKDSAIETINKIFKKNNQKER